MANEVFVSSDSLTRVQWMWKSNKDPWSKSQADEWSYYSDVENEIVEEAFNAKKTNVLIDNHRIDFERSIQISISDEKKQRLVRRLVSKRDNEHLREERFLTNPFNPNCPFNGQYGWVSLFIVEMRKHLKLKYGQLPSRDRTILPTIVESAARGIVEEGKILGKKRESEWIANKLIEHKDKKFADIWKCCAHLYTMESFLYKRLNENMKLIGPEAQEHIWRKIIPTLGPFCLLLWNNPLQMMPTKKDKTLYRGANLPDALIASVKTQSQDSNMQGSFQAFTSATRNRAKAERSGNVLFIMQLKCAYTTDLSSFSDYADEEEELIHPGVSFTTERAEFDETNKKHFIYLNLAHCRVAISMSAEDLAKGREIYQFIEYDFPHLKDNVMLKQQLCYFYLKCNDQVSTDQLFQQSLIIQEKQ